jgi:hypothetical protein
VLLGFFIFFWHVGREITKTKKNLILVSLLSSRIYNMYLEKNTPGIDLSHMSLCEKCRGDDNRRDVFNMCLEAIDNNHLNCLKSIYSNYDMVDEESLFAKAAASGNLDIIGYLYVNGCHRDETACYCAVGNGHLETLRYLHDRRCPWDPTLFECAITYDQIDCLKYMISHGCPYDDDIKAFVLQETIVNASSKYFIETVIKGDFLVHRFVQNVICTVIANCAAETIQLAWRKYLTRMKRDVYKGDTPMSLLTPLPGMTPPPWQRSGTQSLEMLTRRAQGLDLDLNTPASAIYSSGGKINIGNTPVTPGPAISVYLRSIGKRVSLNLQPSLSKLTDELEVSFAEARSSVEKGSFSPILGHSGFKKTDDKPISSGTPQYANTFSFTDMSSESLHDSFDALRISKSGGKLPQPVAPKKVSWIENDIFALRQSWDKNLEEPQEITSYAGLAWTELNVPEKISGVSQSVASGDLSQITHAKFGESPRSLSTLCEQASYLVPQSTPENRVCKPDLHSTLLEETCGVHIPETPYFDAYEKIHTPVKSTHTRIAKIDESSRSRDSSLKSWFGEKEEKEESGEPGMLADQAVCTSSQNNTCSACLANESPGGIETFINICANCPAQELGADTKEETQKEPDEVFSSITSALLGHMSQTLLVDPKSRGIDTDDCVKNVLDVFNDKDLLDPAEKSLTDVLGELTLNIPQSPLSPVIARFDGSFEKNAAKEQSAQDVQKGTSPMLDELQGSAHGNAVYCVNEDIKVGLEPDVANGSLTACTELELEIFPGYNPLVFSRSHPVKDPIKKSGSPDKENSDPQESMEGEKEETQESMKGDDVIGSGGSPDKEDDLQESMEGEKEETQESMKGDDMIGSGGSPNKEDDLQESMEGEKEETQESMKGDDVIGSGGSPDKEDDLQESMEGEKEETQESMEVDKNIGVDDIIEISSSTKQNDAQQHSAAMHLKKIIDVTKLTPAPRKAKIKKTILQEKTEVTVLIKNPRTGRWVKKDGKKGKDLMMEYGY